MLQMCLLLSSFDWVSIEFGSALAKKVLVRKGRACCKRGQATKEIRSKRRFGAFRQHQPL